MKKDDGLHHEEATRTKRDRDGVQWDSTGGQGVTKGQCSGYSGQGDLMKGSKDYKAGKGGKS